MSTHSEEQRMSRLAPAAVDAREGCQRAAVERVLRRKGDMRLWDRLLLPPQLPKECVLVVAPLEDEELDLGREGGADKRERKRGRRRTLAG